MRTALVLVFTEVSKDPRVLRHIDALQDHYRVVSCGKGPAPGGVARHYEIPSDAEHLPLTPRGLLALATRRSRGAYKYLPAANHARTMLRTAEFDVVIANDITTVPVALDVAGGRPVVADLHEYAPREMEDDWRWRLLVQPFASALCRDYLAQAAAVTTVADGIATEYSKNYGIEPRLVLNAGQYRNPQPRSVGSPVQLVHSGMATPNRQLELMIEAAADVPGLVLDLYLIPAHRQPKYLGHLKSLAAGTSNVRIRPPVPMSDVPTTLDAYDVGIYVLQPTNFNNLHALPNKFFDFVQSGLGIIVGPSPEMATLVQQHGIGEVLPDFNPHTLRTALSSLDPDRVAQWKQRSCTAAKELSSDESAVVLRSVVAGALAGSKSPGPQEGSGDN